MEVNHQTSSKTHLHIYTIDNPPHPNFRLHARQILGITFTQMRQHSITTTTSTTTITTTTSKSCVLITSHNTHAIQTDADWRLYIM